MTGSELFRAAQPIIPTRGVHLDLKGMPPTANRFRELLKLFAAAHYNAVLVEWEDTFPWTVDERFRSPTAYTAEDIRHFQEAARTLGLEIIPLVQCLGHMETPLSVPGYEHLREELDDSSVLNPLAAGARDLVQRMVDDVLNLLPEIRYFHLGGDEAWSMGKHSQTKVYIDEHGKGALYLQHVEPILDSLNARGIRPILWHDMMINWETDALRVLAAKSDLLTWGYSGHPDTTDHHFSTKYIKRFHDHSITLWGGTAYKGADGHNVDRPDIQQRERNALAWMEIAQRYGYVGVIATGWSRYSTDRVQCEPIDASLDSLVNIGVIMHDGRPPEGGIDACISSLEELGERDRFESCKTAMENLAAIRQRGWQSIQSLREQVVFCRKDARRRGSRMASKSLSKLRDILGEADEVAEEVKMSFAGLVEPIWIEEYLSTRLTPLREELFDLKRSGSNQV